MIRFLLFFTIALSVASATLSFLTKQRAENLSSNLSSTTQASGLLKTEASKLKQEKKTALDRVDELSKGLEEQKAQLEKIAGSLKEVQTKETKLQSEVTEKSELIAKLKKQAEEAAAAPPAPVPDPAQEKLIKELKDELEKSKLAAEEEKKRAAEKVEELKGKMAQMIPKPVINPDGTGPGVKAPAIGRVVAWNEGWNFVVVNLGDKNGVTPESKLEVQRNGKALATLRISEVRPTHTSAGVDYLDGRRKERVQPGDTVVFSPKSAAAAQAEPVSFNDLFGPKNTP